MAQVDDQSWSSLVLDEPLILKKGQDVLQVQARVYNNEALSPTMLGLMWSLTHIQETRKQAWIQEFASVEHEALLAASVVMF